MNINYIGQILTTTSLIFEVDNNGKLRAFCVKGDSGATIEDNNLIFTDYIEDRSFSLPSDTLFVAVHAKGDVLPSFLESANYVDYIASKQEQIDANNKLQQVWFDKLKKYFEFIEHDERNLYFFKTEVISSILPQIPCMNSFGVKDLYRYIKCQSELMPQIKSNCLSILKDQATRAINDLESERQKFIIEGDQDSIEEIDVIVEMINEAVNDTSFESIVVLDDAAKLWPPILLPAPFIVMPTEEEI
jgi:hypothetical protein